VELPTSQISVVEYSPEIFKVFHRLLRLILILSSYLCIISRSFCPVGFYSFSFGNITYNLYGESNMRCFVIINSQLCLNMCHKKVFAKQEEFQSYLTYRLLVKFDDFHVKGNTCTNKSIISRELGDWSRSKC